MPPRYRWNQWILRLLQDLKKWKTEKSLWKIWDFEEKSDRKFLNHETKSEQNKSKILNFYFKLIRFRLFRVPFQKDETTWSWAEKSQEMTQVSFTFRVGGPSTRGLRNPPPPPAVSGVIGCRRGTKVGKFDKIRCTSTSTTNSRDFFLGKKMLKRWLENSACNYCLFVVVADRRATARTTTFVEPCSIQTTKKEFFGGKELGSSLRIVILRCFLFEYFIVFLTNLELFETTRIPNSSTMCWVFWLTLLFNSAWSNR